MIIFCKIIIIFLKKIKPRGLYFGNSAWSPFWWGPGLNSPLLTCCKNWIIKNIYIKKIIIEKDYINECFHYQILFTFPYTSKLDICHKESCSSMALLVLPWRRTWVQIPPLPVIISQIKKIKNKNVQGNKKIHINQIWLTWSILLTGLKK